MNRLQTLFDNKPEGLLSVYFTAGYPELDSTGEILRALADTGSVDLVEVGVPFSDPMADGPVIQHSSTVALRNGMTLKTLLDQVAAVRPELPSSLPLVLMGYLNVMMQYGIERLFADCQRAGIDAIIVPDLPWEDYLADFKELSRKYGIPLVMLITPETSDDRIRRIDDGCDGFIYMVSAASTTGTRDSFGEQEQRYFGHVNNLGLKHNRLIGFGISNPGTFRDACTYSSGAIVGSLFIKCLDRQSIPADAVSDLLQTLGIKKTE